MTEKIKSYLRRNLYVFVSLIYAVVVWAFGNMINLNNVGIVLTLFGGVLLLVAIPLGYGFIQARAKSEPVLSAN